MLVSQSSSYNTTYRRNHYNETNKCLMREVTVIKEATAYKELYILVSIHSCSLHSITHATQLLSSLNYSCYSVALFTRLLMLRSCSLYSINHTTQLLSSLNYSCYSVALFTRLLMLLSCSLYPITQTSPTVFFSRNHIILPIGVASSSGRYLKFSSQRRRKFISTAASETERKRPADAVLS